MKPFFGRILFATDFSECLKPAQAFAIFLVQGFGAHLDVVNVIEFKAGMDEEAPVAKIYIDHYIKDSAKKMEELTGKIGKNIKGVRSHQKVGAPADQINQFALRQGSGLVILGTHGWSGIERVLLGSTAERVVRGAPCPVMTVRWKHHNPKEKEKEWTPSLTRLLVPVDFSDCSLEALEIAIQVAKPFGSEVVLMHVVEARGYGIDFTLSHHSKNLEEGSKIESRLKDLVRDYQSQGMKTLYHLREGFPSDLILEEARKNLSDLIVMGTHGRRGFSRLASGSVAESILRHSPCPVLTVKSQKFRHAFVEKPIGLGLQPV